MMTDRPPQLRHHAISLPLPVSEELWNAKTSEEFQTLQWSEPSGRAQLRFNHLIRDFVFEKKYHVARIPLSELDRHLALCAVQGEIWETAQELDYCCVTGNSNGPMQNSTTYPWHEYFDHLITASQSGLCVGTDATSWISSMHFTTILCHLSTISLHSHSRKLRHDTECTLCASAFHPFDPSPDSSTFTWAQSPAARRTVFSAVSLFSLFWQNADTSTVPEVGRFGGIAFNPLSATARFRAGDELLAYAKSVTTCSYCCPGGGAQTIPLEPLNLLSNELNRAQVQEWIANGGPAALGSLGICKCNASDISALFTM